ncbi:MAG: ABC transporter permease [Nitratireductor sp.]
MTEQHHIPPAENGTGEPAPRSGDKRVSAGQKPAEQGSAGRKTGRVPSLYSGKSLVPREGVAGQALLTVIAIMAFLACLTLGAVMLVRDTARGWQTDIAKEVTVQIRPFDNVDMEASIKEASQLLLSFEGISKVTVLNDEATAKLLEPFLGSGLQVEELPIPTLMTVSLEPGSRPDLETIRQRLAAEIPGASLDDHRNWVDRLNNMAGTTVAAGIVIFLLVMTATVLTVVFATRGAMAANREIVEVLHFVGAERAFIARAFETHFLRLGMMGALGGGLAAIFVFLGLGIWTSMSRATPQGDQVSALFGTFAVGPWGILGIVLVSVAIAVLTGLTSRFTVMRHVAQLETYGAKP